MLFTESERLAALELEWVAKNHAQLNTIFKKIEGKRKSEIAPKEKVLISEFLDIRFSNGKIAAYLFCLQQMNGGRIQIPEECPNLIRWANHYFPKNV